MSVLKMRWEACLASVEVIFNRQVLYYAAIYMLFSLCIYTYWTFCKQFQLSQNTWVKMQNKHTWGNYTMRGLGVLVFVGVFWGVFWFLFLLDRVLIRSLLEQQRWLICLSRCEIWPSVTDFYVRLRQQIVLSFVSGIKD